MTARVFIVDDEEDLVWTLTRQLTRERPELVVEGFSDPSAALERAKTVAPDVLVTDLRMPKLGGIELVIAVRHHCPFAGVIVMTAFSTAHVREEVTKQGAVTFLEKPFELSALLEALDRTVGARRGFRGDISIPMLPDLIQLYALSRSNGALRITRGDETGVLWFQSGEVVHASCGANRGVTAFHALVGWEGGRFRFEVGAEPPERSISEPWQSLLLEGCRILDESRRDDPESDRPLDDPVFGEGPPVASRQEPLLRVDSSPSLPALADGDSLHEVAARLRRALPTAWLADSLTNDQSDWKATLDELVRLVRPLSRADGRGVLEVTGGGAGFAIVWGSGDRRIVLGSELPRRDAVSRFRLAISSALRADWAAEVAEEP